MLSFLTDRLLGLLPPPLEIGVLWFTCLPSPLATRPCAFNVLRAALRVARFFFCSAVPW